MSHYKPYPAYKDSGIEWLSMVPEHWEKIPLKWIFDCLDGQRIPLNSEQRSEIPGEIPYWGSGGIVGYISKHIFDEDLILLGEDGAPFFDKDRPVAYAISGKSWINNHIHVLRALRKLPSSWFVHYLNSVEYRLYIDGSTRDKLTQEDMKEIVLLVPPLDEAVRTLMMLDRETARIDALISKKTRFIELLREKRQALITHAVTKGLNPNVKMKDSGVEWLGEVPEHWSVSIMGRLEESGSDFVSGPFGSSLGTDDYVLEGVPVIRGLNTTLRAEKKFVDEEFVFVSEAKFKELSRCDAMPGDVIFTARGTVGKVGVVPGSFSKGLISPNQLRFRPTSKKIESDYIYYFFSCQSVIHQVELNAESPAQPNLNLGDLKSLLVILPTPVEQREIVEHLDREIARIDTLIKKSDRSIELLKERRFTLITAAISGHIDLSKS